MNDQQTLPSENPADLSQEHDDLWRDEIHSRVAGYRTRRGRRVEGAFSMRFPFPPSESEPAAELSDSEDGEEATVPEMELVAGDAQILPADLAEPSHASLAVAVAEPEPAPLPPIAELESGIKPAPELDPEPPPAPIPLPRPKSRRKVIAFPRQISEAPPPIQRLADPVIPEQPRILDVPEELEAYPTTPLLDGLQFAAHPNAAPDIPHDHIELPFQSVELSRRLHAGFIDCLLVAAAVGIFGAAGYNFLPKLAPSKPLLISAGAIPVIFWAVYQYLFTMYGGATVGMRVARLRLLTFNGRAPNWRHRRSRVFGIYFSTASLLMGLMWALVDVDGLCWHDRISRTYLTTGK